jgi:hypothetical protein
MEIKREQRKLSRSDCEENLEGELSS